MKKIPLLILACLLGTFIINAQSLNWQWARSSGGPSTGVQEGWAVSADKTGNVYVSGYYEGDSIIFGNQTLMSAGGYNQCLVKYSPSGNLLWARGPVVSHDVQMAEPYIATDDSGNVYLTAQFRGDSVIFGGINLGYNNLHNDNNLLLVKYDSTGNVLWAKRFGDSTSYIVPGGITTDAMGHIILTGAYSGSSLRFGSFNVPATNVGNIFTARLDATGQVQWVKTAAGPQVFAQGTGVATDGAGSVYVTGWFEFDSIVLDRVVLHNPTPSTAGMLLKYDSAGNISWGTVFTGPRVYVLPNGIAVDARGNSYLTGNFYYGALNFGQFTLQDNGNPSLFTAFIARYDSAGNVRWARPAVADSNTNTNGYGIATTGGEIYVSGGFYGGSFTFDGTSVPLPAGQGVDPMFLLTLSPDGNVICSGSFVSGGDDQNAVCVDNKGNAFVGGDLVPNNPLIFGSDTVSAPAAEDIFVAKFNCGSIKESIIEPVSEAKLQIFPNPFTGQCVARYALPANAKNGSLVMYDLLGREREHYKLDSDGGELSISSSSLSPGIYFYSLMVEDMVVVTKKIVVE